MLRRLALTPGLLALLLSGRLAAQETAPPAPEAACFPGCRDGFTCYQQKCVSLCNPACPAGLECVEGRRCEPPVPQSSQARPYEPPPPLVKPFASRGHNLIGFHLGLPGNFNRDGAEQDLATSLGFMLRGDMPLADYVLLGPMLQFGSWRPEQSPAAKHSYYVDLDLVVRFRAPITTSKYNYQLWLGMPIGVSVSVPSSDFADAGPGIGWNVGVLFGGAMHFTPKFGMFAETGWEQHRLTHTRDGQSDLDLRLQQALINVGFVVRN